MMRGIAVPTTVWSTADRSIAIMTETMTAAMRLRLSVRPQGCGAAAAAAAESAAGASVRVSAMGHRPGRRRGGSGLTGDRGFVLHDPQQAAEAEQKSLQFGVGECVQPALGPAPRGPAAGARRARRRPAWP